MAQHKIQSSTGLILELEQVPKVLGKLVNEWAPQAFVVSFKLETDESILFTKAWGAIEKYNVHLVVANVLHTREDKCYLVQPLDRPLSQGQWAQNQILDVMHGRQRSITTILRSPDMSQIEPALVRKVVQAYWAHLGHHQAPTDSTAEWREVCIGNKIRTLAENYVQMITYSSESNAESAESVETKVTVSFSFVYPVSIALLFMSGMGLAYYAGTLHPRDIKR